MTRYVSTVVADHDQFVADYAAITKYRVPNLDQPLMEHAMEYISRIAPDRFPITHIPPLIKTYGGRSKKREFAFCFSWNESTERFEIQYTGFADVVTPTVDFFDVTFDRWSSFESDYQALAKKESAIGFEDLRQDVFKKLCGKRIPESGTTHKVWLRENQSKKGARCWFDIGFFMEDDSPIIRYEGFGILETKAFAVSDVRFENWENFETQYTKLVNPEFAMNFEEQKEEFARECVTDAGASHKRALFVGGDKTKNRRGYKFWFLITNDAETPVVRFNNYSFS